jgi:hypothetical protein
VIYLVNGTPSLCSRNIPFILALPFFIVLSQLLYLFLSHPQFINNDVTLFAHTAQLVLAGKVPYVDFVEFNAPLAFYLYVPVVWLAESLHQPLSIFISIFGWLLIVYSLGASFLILRSHAEPDEWIIFLPLLFAFLLVNLALSSHLAQRDYVFALLMMPFFLLRWQRRRGAKQNPLFAIFIGSIAAIGTLIKPPFFPLLPLTFEVYWLVESRKLLARLTDPEVLAAIGTSLLLIGWFFIAAPESMRNAYLMHWAPFAVLAATNGSYYKHIKDILSFASFGYVLPPIPIIVITTLIALALSRRASICLALLIWTTASWCIYLMQGKGFAYHTIPVLIGYFMLVSLELAMFARRLLQKCNCLENICRGTNWNKLTTTFIAYSILLCIFLPFLVENSRNTLHSIDRLRSVVLCNTKPGDAVLVLAINNWDACPVLVKDGRRAASRYLATFPFVVYETLKYKSTDPQKRCLYNEREQAMFKEISEDVERTKPALIAIEFQPIWPLQRGVAISIFSYMAANGLLSFLDDYQPVGLINGYAVWKREIGQHGY